MKVIVKHTFIDVVQDFADQADPLYRTVSEPTGRSTLWRTVSDPMARTSSRHKDPLNRSGSDPIGATALAVNNKMIDALGYGNMWRRPSLELDPWYVLPQVDEEPAKEDHAMKSTHFEDEKNKIMASNPAKSMGWVPHITSRDEGLALNCEPVFLCNYDDDDLDLPLQRSCSVFEGIKPSKSVFFPSNVASPMTVQPSFNKASISPAMAGGAAETESNPVSPAGPLSTAQCLPAVGKQHFFHIESKQSGELSEDMRGFMKTAFQGRLTTITEASVRSGGTHRYVVQFTGGNLSNADGVGFIFSPALPCPKNIQQITSVFVNRAGSICFRSNSDVTRSQMKVKQLEVGEIIEVAVNLDEQTALFTVWPLNGGLPVSALFAYGGCVKDKDQDICLGCGYFACVVKHLGISVQLGS